MTGFAHGFTVTVRRQPDKDRWGDATGSPTTHTVEGCAFYLPSSNELTEGRDTVLDRGVLLAPYGADILAVDQIVLPAVDAVPPAYRNTTWRVDGSPEQWRSPFTGWAPGAQFTLTREAG